MNILQRLFGRSDTVLQLEAERARNQLLEQAIITALHTSQELNRQHQTSLDRVIQSRFDIPYADRSNVEPQSHQVFPVSALSDLLEMDDAAFAAQE
jgi:hypothetical protein